jgi:hypothetical protein
MTVGEDRPAPRMRLVSFKPMVKGSLRGLATVQLPNGLRITECPVLTSNGKAWETFPIDGKKQYTSILAWPDRETADRWSLAVVELVRAKHPGALQ